MSNGSTSTMQKSDITCAERTLTKFDIQMKRLENEKLKIEMPVDLAKLGLRGTLTGALCGMLFLLLLPIIDIFSQHLQLTGVHICILTGIISTTVVLYGAFVFERSTRIVADWKKGFEAGTTSSSNTEQSSVGQADSTMHKRTASMESDRAKSGGA